MLLVREQAKLLKEANHLINDSVALEKEKK